MFYSQELLRVATAACLMISFGLNNISAKDSVIIQKGAQFAKVHQLLVDAVEKQKIAGATALVLEKGKTVFEDAVGWQDISHDQKMSSETIFRIASMTKPITSVAIMMLKEQGKLRVSDPVSKYLPEFSSNQITIHHLLTHTSGLLYDFQGQSEQAKCFRSKQVTSGIDGANIPLSENIQRLAQCPLMFKPGESWAYGMSTDVLGRVVEVVSGQSLAEFFQQHIFEPMEMNDTAFFVPEEKLNRFATLYRPTKEASLEPSRSVWMAEKSDDPMASFQLREAPTYLSGGAGLVSTGADYIRFLSMLLGNGKLGDIRLLQAKTVAEMTKNQIGDLECAFPIHGDKFGYGFGVHVHSNERNGASLGSYSWGGLYHTFFWVDPKKQLVAVLMTQLLPNDHLSLRKDFQQSVNEAVSDSSEDTPSGLQSGAVYREYWNSFGGPRNWRVTDPQAKARGAQEFLPNPRLCVSIGDLKHAIRAEAVLDRWGGHLKTSDKRIRFNENPWITVPEISTTPTPAAYYYSQDYPTIEVPLTDLREGENLLEATCSAFPGFDWGQWGMYSIGLRIYYDPAKKGSIPRGRIVSPASGATLAENPSIVVEAQSDVGIEKVYLIGKYDGYDENGDGVFRDWHQAYFSESREQAPEMSGHLGTLRSPPYEITWDTRLLPDQNNQPIELMARIEGTNGLCFVPEPVVGLQFERIGESVKLFRAKEFPLDFGVRAGQQKSCVFEMPREALEKATVAVLPLRTWHGWDEHHEKLQLNDYEFAIGGKDHYYDIEYHSIPIDALRAGENRFTIESNTEHHMLEVLWPGPVLIVRYQE